MLERKLHSVPCAHCAKDFSLRLTQYKQRLAGSKGQKLFCSQECVMAHRKLMTPRVEVLCASCAKGFSVFQSKYDLTMKISKTGNFFCTTTCATALRKKQTRIRKEEAKRV